jgi:hypothetical protein
VVQNGAAQRDFRQKERDDQAAMCTWRIISVSQASRMKRADGDRARLAK